MGAVPLAVTDGVAEVRGDADGRGDALKAPLALAATGDDDAQPVALMLSASETDACTGVKDASALPLIDPVADTDPLLATDGDVLCVKDAVGDTDSELSRTLGVAPDDSLVDVDTRGDIDGARVGVGALEAETVGVAVSLPRPVAVSAPLRVPAAALPEGHTDADADDVVHAVADTVPLTVDVDAAEVLFNNVTVIDIVLQPVALCDTLDEAAALPVTPWVKDRMTVVVADSEGLCVVLLEPQVDVDAVTDGVAHDVADVQTVFDAESEGV